MIYDILQGCAVGCVIITAILYGLSVAFTKYIEVYRIYTQVKNHKKQKHNYHVQQHNNPRDTRALYVGADNQARIQKGNQIFDFDDFDSDECRQKMFELKIVPDPTFGIKGGNDYVQFM